MLTCHKAHSEAFKCLSGTQHVYPTTKLPGTQEYPTTKET